MADDETLDLVFERSEEGGYHVYAPSLPGLHTEGDTIEEAQANFKDALALYVATVGDEGGHVESRLLRPTFRTAPP